MFLASDDHILLMDNPAVFPHYTHLGDRSCTRADFARLAGAGIRTVVIYTNWSAIERQLGQRDWSSLDRSIGDAQAAGLKVLLSDFTWGATCLPDEWYTATTSGTDKRWGQLSMWHADATEYAEDFIRELARRYVGAVVCLYSTHANYGETYIIGETPNGFYDPAALASYREFVGDANARPNPYTFRCPRNADPLTEEWLRNSIVNYLLRRQAFVMALNDRRELWTSAHHLWAHQGAGSGAVFIRDVLDAYKRQWPDAAINCIQYTYWYHGAYGYKQMLDEDIDRYGLTVYAGAEYCEGLPQYTPQLLASKLRGFICAPKSVLTTHDKIEDWMLANIAAACRAIGEKHDR